MVATKDAEIELAAGQTVSEIFADYGEPYFRKGESRVIARLLRDALSPRHRLRPRLPRGRRA
ncbi:MAG: hypothetical protein HC794_02650 [Nitrospiraceae bacterium]|nr:hypothetical protein [Nitrospiraceae bacterium]